MRYPDSGGLSARARLLCGPRGCSPPMVGFVARLLPDINVAPRTSLNAPAGTGRRLRVVRLDLEAAREVAHAHGAKVNDLILTIVRGRIVKDRFVAGVRCGRTRLR
ncbi:wax ester/triacylglycerol synthase domain-containing protein [Streptosporangium sp. NPDC005286]|uniref:wax ester/triacylglycerol synthase domain-containing protein n=1 Tax=Streptosporangium sp. NPDC005286 TaxID=3154463 RepID=UPI0033AFC2A2